MSCWRSKMKIKIREYSASRIKTASQTHGNKQVCNPIIACDNSRTISLFRELLDIANCKQGRGFIETQLTSIPFQSTSFSECSARLLSVHASYPQLRSRTVSWIMCELIYVVKDTMHFVSQLHSKLQDFLFIDKLIHKWEVLNRDSSPFLQIDIPQDLPEQSQVAVALPWLLLKMSWKRWSDTRYINNEK
jgi:hypothetical protein